MSRYVKIVYRNWRGEWGERVILPSEDGVVWTCNQWHPEKQWLLPAFDVAKEEHRFFAMSGIRERTPMQLGWKPEP